MSKKQTWVTTVYHTGKNDPKEIPDEYKPGGGKDQRRLLVLDVDDTLYHGSFAPLDREPDTVFFAVLVYKRPYFKEFLEFCFRNFDVAFWTTVPRASLNNLVTMLEMDRTKIKFAWSRYDCNFVHDYNSELKENGEPVRYVKDIMKLDTLGLKQSAFIMAGNLEGGFTRNFHNVIPISKYDGSKDDVTLLKTKDYIEALLQGRKVEFPSGNEDEDVQQSTSEKDIIDERKELPSYEEPKYLGRSRR